MSLNTQDIINTKLLINKDACSEQVIYERIVMTRGNLYKNRLVHYITDEW